VSLSTQRSSHPGCDLATYLSTRVKQRCRDVEILCENLNKFYLTLQRAVFQYSGWKEHTLARTIGNYADGQTVKVATVMSVPFVMFLGSP